MALLKKSHNDLFLKFTFVDSCVCSYFPTASLKNPSDNNPSKRRQVLWQKRSVQAGFPVFCSSWTHFSLSFAAYIFLTTQQMQLSQCGVLVPPSLHAHTCSVPLKERLRWCWHLGLFLQEVSHLLAKAFMPLSLEGVEFYMGCLAPACRI